jgi:ATP-dependent DNA helicase RecQ
MVAGSFAGGRSPGSAFISWDSAHPDQPCTERPFHGSTPSEFPCGYTRSVSAQIDLLSALHRYWGYSSFRPLQEQIVGSLLSGHDTCVVMPTGGGKSLCYQLPALALGKTAVVVSPLIALMQDQTAQLAQMGIPAAVLNSMLTGDEQARVMRNASSGAYRLLYLSPERLARGQTIEWLQSVPIAFFAIDEAHCISEWGHEFRPEYRQLSCLRTHFPDQPIAAFTASATRRVRHDILHQLQLRAPHKYIASFHRANLRYVVHECDRTSQPQLLVRALKHSAPGNVIVYAPTIARVEETVDFLADQRIPAVAYHGKMEGAERRRNQERWMSDEVRVLVGTIAFGLGINKASVRAVIHLSLPKSIEQYYQEAGRAGRDGNPADCLLLWQKRDAGLLAHFIGQIVDPAETERAWQRYRNIRDFVESNQCRHQQICLHFGETPKWNSCGACDVCGSRPEWLEVTVPTIARKRRRLRSSPALPREVPDVTISAKAAGHVDQALREYLREWRRASAQRQGVPAYVVMHDSSLEELCRVRPRSLSELHDITGFGERKIEVYGERVLGVLAAFERGARALETSEKKIKPVEETLRLLAQGKTFAEIAKLRERQLGTVVATVANLVESGELEFAESWVDPGKQAQIETVCARLGTQWLKPLKEALPSDITFEDVRLVVARLRRRDSAAKQSASA